MRYLNTILAAFWTMVIGLVVLLCFLCGFAQTGDAYTSTHTHTYTYTRADISLLTCLEPDETVETMLAQLVWGEARGCTTTEQAAVIWCVLNRVDDADFPNTIQEVVTQPRQFIGYDPNHPVEQDKIDLARDVLSRWQRGGEGRVLPEEYVFFHGDGVHNHFRTEYRHSGAYWNWSLKSPYTREWKRDV